MATIDNPSRYLKFIRMPLDRHLFYNIAHRMGIFCPMRMVKYICFEKYTYRYPVIRPAAKRCGLPCRSLAREMNEPSRTPGDASRRLPDSLFRMMKKQGYHFVGAHSAVKICAYASSGMKKGGKTCYKQRFYGIRSWRCIQASPAIGCNLACAFCWRIIPEEAGIKWNELNAVASWDDPEGIADGMIEEQRRLVSGFKGMENVDRTRWLEANEPRHVALSLTGEPLFYPKMGELISAFHARGISTFLVTNGTMAKALASLGTMPTQLYVSVQAPNREVYERTVRPKTVGAWQKFMEFLEVFHGLETRKAFRMTLVKGLNMLDPAGYAELIKKGKPDYVEVKGFVFVGGARGEGRGLTYGQMPGKEEIMAFASEVADLSGYLLVDYHESSKVALLCADRAAAERRIIDFAETGGKSRTLHPGKGKNIA